jgi:PPOX class probable F420-dependent enzyme
MSSHAVPDASSSFGKRVRARLAEESLVWLTTVGADGTPQPNPVWFLWDGADSILIYNRSGAKRIQHVKANARVSLNFDGNGQGGDIVVLTGDAELLPEDYPLADADPAFTEKYAEHAARIFADTSEFAAKYPVAMRIRISKVRGM